MKIRLHVLIVNEITIHLNKMTMILSKYRHIYNLQQCEKNHTLKSTIVKGPDMTKENVFNSKANLREKKNKIRQT